MAFVTGDIVTQRPASTAFSLGAQPQPPQFGVITDVQASPPGFNDVLWPDGHVEAGIPDAALDKIQDPDANELARLQNLVVLGIASGTTKFPGDYAGLVVTMYKRDAGGAGTPSATFALVKIIENGLYLEIASASLDPVTR